MPVTRLYNDKSQHVYSLTETGCGRIPALRYLVPFMWKMLIHENSTNVECKRNAGGIHTPRAYDKIGQRIFRRHNEPCSRALNATRTFLYVSV
jgi:hypothetical protein